MYGLTTRVYRQGYVPFGHPGLVKLVVQCPETLVRGETEWIDHAQANSAYDTLVHQVVLARLSRPPPPKPIRFHQQFDF